MADLSDAAPSPAEPRDAFVRRRVRGGIPYIAVGFASLLIIRWLDGGSPRDLWLFLAIGAAGGAAIYLPIAVICARLEWRWCHRLYNGEL